EQLVLIGEDGAKWGANENSAFIAEGKYWVNNHAHVLRPNRKKVLDKYLVELLNTSDLSHYITDLNVPKLNQGNLKEIKIPLPPLNIQKDILKEIEVFEREENAGREKTQKLKNEIENLFKSSFSKAKTTYRLSDSSIFDISIGKRVLNREL